ncbi:hypothetical protein CesoFtcFv8_027013 [Champsocephalus esox]|uniref:Uncharacterized protein n=1 Tax=Champsocephalus esox TaxID=159716 RepID=A0AAN8B095_9TELE|nr:hypothetical protein CesoFtcFv8_027013 [Champsocephalus esox]
MIRETRFSLSAPPSKVIDEQLIQCGRAKHAAQSVESLSDTPWKPLGKEVSDERKRRESTECVKDERRRQGCMREGQREGARRGGGRW